ncbi:MAG: hypothetical protein JNN30_09560 [Rhodanobacteraceae bacterium]|nr:hypothetical protein [Rhodanobacteraceae bacterium]
MGLAVLAIVLWLPILVGATAVIVAIALIVTAWRRRTQAHGASGRNTHWPATVSVIFLVIGAGGTLTALCLWGGCKMGSGDDLDAASRGMARLHHGCVNLSIRRLTDFIAQQRPEYRHDLEGQVLRRTWYCAVPQSDGPLPDASARFSPAERDALRRIASTHRWRAGSNAAASGEPYRPSWAADADAVDGVLLWQEHGLAVFDEVFDAPALPNDQRVTYLGLAALHCLQTAFADDCPRRITPPRLEQLIHNRHPVLWWRPGLLEDLRIAALAAASTHRNEAQEAQLAH